MFVITKELPQIITRMLKKTPCHLRGNARAGFIKFIVETIFMIKVESLSTKVRLDHGEGRLNWAKIR